MALIWKPPVALSKREERVLSKCKKAKLFVFLRLHRHELFDESFQQELAEVYPERARGKEPVAPALLAMVTLLQAALGVSDEDAVEFAAVELRWQMLLDCLGAEDAPFSQGALYNFRQRLIGGDLDRRLLERTVELARRTKVFGATALRAAFDASPLFGAGRVEDTFNLIGHAARQLLGSVARRLSVSVEEAAERAGIALLKGTSTKAALDIDWDDPKAKKAALEQLLQQANSLASFVERELVEEASRPPIADQLSTLRQVAGQDIEPDPDGGGVRIKEGVAKERRISIADGQMRHGRKSKSSRIDGYKRHIALDLDEKLIVAVAVTPANRPEAEATDDLMSDVERDGRQLAQLHIDRGYLAAPAVAQARARGVQVLCKPFPLRNAGRFTKADFILELDTQQLRCPEGHKTALKLGHVARFPIELCRACPSRSRCTTAASAGRSVSIHSAEPLLLELRQRRAEPDGRRALRERVLVEHGLAALSRTQGRRARYLGVRKNLFDVRRHAAVANLHVAAARAA